VLSYLVTSTARRRLLELLWRHDAVGSASDLARRARVSFASAYRELKLMEEFGLVSVHVEDGRELYAAASAHPDAELMRRLVATRSSSYPPDDEAAATTRRRARALGAPLPVPAEPVADEEREQVVVDAVRLSRRDATLARVLPVVLWRQRHRLDRKHLKELARRAHEKHALGFLVALTAELSGDPSLDEWAEGLRDHRAKGVRPFFELPSARATRALADRRTPEVAARWGYRMDLDLDAFRSTFDKFAASDA